jgi:hypothetical protein
VGSLVEGVLVDCLGQLVRREAVDVSKPGPETVGVPGDRPGRVVVVNVVVVSPAAAPARVRVLAMCYPHVVRDGGRRAGEGRLVDGFLTRVDELGTDGGDE